MLLGANVTFLNVTALKPLVRVALPRVPDFTRSDHDIALLLLATAAGAAAAAAAADPPTIVPMMAPGRTHVTWMQRHAFIACSTGLGRCAICQYLVHALLVQQVAWDRACEQFPWCVSLSQHKYTTPTHAYNDAAYHSLDGER